MTSVASPSNPLAAAVPPHRHHHRADTAAVQADPLASATGSAAPAGGAPAGAAGGTGGNPGAGIQKFAAELQSILLSAQSGQPAASNVTASDPATATDPAGATDPTATPGSIRHVADRLQQLLGGAGTAASADGDQSGSLQSVLNRLQQTLQQTLRSYGSTPSAAPGANLTA